MVNSSLTWDSNTRYIVKRANARMRMLHKLVEFSVSTEDLVNIFILYIRLIPEQSCQVWHSRLTLENLMDIERVQKNALKIILKDDYISYEHALDSVGLDCLADRRQQLCLKFAKACLKHPEMKEMFPYNQHGQREKFHVTFESTDRLKESGIPFMQRLLNADTQV